MYSDKGVSIGLQEDKDTQIFSCILNNLFP